MTSIRVSAETAASSRVRKPTVRPTGSPSSEGHAAGGGAGGEAARLQHQDSAVAAPGGVQQGERDERGLAGAGRGDQHGVASGGQRGQQGGERVGNGEIEHDGEVIERKRAKQARPGRCPGEPWTRKGTALGTGI